MPNLSDILGIATSGQGISSGTFTPTLVTGATGFTSVTYSSQTGYYVRSGNLVFVEIDLQISSITVGSASGGTAINGLPFAVSSDPSLHHPSWALGYCTGFTFNPSFTQKPGGTREIGLYKQATAGADTLDIDPQTDVGTGAKIIRVSGSYITADPHPNASYPQGVTQETGTFTPTYSPQTGAFGSITYAKQSGHYVRTGRKVEFEIALQTSALTLGSATGALYVDGLPFTQHLTYQAAMPCGYTTGWGSLFPMFMLGQPNSTKAALTTQNSIGTGHALLTIPNMTAGTSDAHLMYASGTFYTDDA